MKDNELLIAMSDMLENKLLLSMSDMLDKKFKPVEDRLKKIEFTLENDVLPRIRNLEACYTSTYKRYQTGIENIDAMKMDIDILKSITKEHSKILHKFI